jgi:hypothetical protein
MLGGRHRRAALERVERLIADGHLRPAALSTIADASVVIASRWLSVGAAYLTLGYAVLVAVHADEGSIDAGTAVRPALASAVVAAALLWWFIPMWRRLTPAARRLLPGMLRREPLEAIEVFGHAAALTLLLVVPFVWVTGTETPTLVVAVVAFGLSLLTEIVATGLSIGRDTGVRDVVRLILQPPYIIGAVIVLAVVAGIVRGVARGLRALFRRGR